MARVEALPQRLGQSHHVDVPHTGREWAVSTVEHRFARRDLHADVRIGARRERPPPRDEGNAMRGGGGGIVDGLPRRRHASGVVVRGARQV